MDENKDFLAPEEEFPELFDHENEVTEEITGEEPAAEPEQVPGAYRGIGAGRKESPFADSPYVIQHKRAEQEPDAPVYRKTEYVPEKKRKSRLGRKILACVAALAILAGSCGLTAGLVNSRWEQRTAKLEASFGQQIAAMQEQINALLPANTGVSVSGTVALGDSLTAAQVYAKNVNSVVLIESTVTANMYGQTATGVFLSFFNFSYVPTI